MPDRSNERSIMEYAIVDGDTERVYWHWRRIWKSTLLVTKLGKIRREHPAAVIQLRGRDCVPLLANPADLLDPKHPHYWDVRFPRRSGRRGLGIPSAPRRYPRELS